MPHLRYRDETGNEAVLPLEAREITIGRQEGCDVFFSHRIVSRMHARIAPRNGRWTIADLGSSHGTYVNRVRIQEHELASGDRIQIGDETLVFEAGPASRSPVAVQSSPGHPGDRWVEKTNPERRLPDAGEDMILAEQKVEEGDLVRTMLGARSVDVASLGEKRSDSFRALMKDAARQVKAAVPAARSDAEVAGHLLALVRMGEELRGCADVEAVCLAAVSMAVRATGASRGVLALKVMDEFVPIVQIDAGGNRTTGERVRISRTFVQKIVAEKVALLAKNTDLDQALATAASVVAIGIRSLLGAPLWDRGDILGWIYLDITGATRSFRPPDLDLVSAIGAMAAGEIVRLRLVDRVREEEARRKNFARFVSSDVARHLEEELRAGADPTSSAREQDATILFADIVRFTSLAERMTAAEVKRFLDDYLGRMTALVVDKHGGTLDKYLGDALMALFGAPFSAGVEEDAVRAVAAAVDMRHAVASLAREKPEYRDVKMRFGINSGKVVAGMIGSERRLEYTVIGDTVNVASRLESTGEPGRILIGETTWTRVKDRFECESAGPRTLRNREQPVNAWWVVARK